MDKRYKPIAYVAGGLFVMIAVAQALIHFGFHDHDQPSFVIALICDIVVGLTFCVFGCWAYIRFPGTRAVGEILATWGIACLLIVLVAPLAGASYPFHSGAGDFFQGIWIFAAVGLGGALLGALIAVGSGKDYRAQALARFQMTAQAKPRRVVKR
jgi:hypothetical protein